MSQFLAMELRGVSDSKREIEGVVVPYNETSYLTPDPRGERILRGAFNRSIHHRETRIPLCRAHKLESAVGKSKSWRDTGEGLQAVFDIRGNADGDQVLEDARDGYLNGLSIGFVPLDAQRAKDGAIEVREGKLMEVSILLIGAYDGAGVLAVRSAQDMDSLLAPFLNPPQIDLSPMPPAWGYERS